MLNNLRSRPGIPWNHHLIPNDSPQHATIAGSQLGEVPGAVYFGGSAGKTSWRFPLCNSMLRYRTIVIMAKLPGASPLGGSARHDAYSCHHQAKAFRFTSLLSRLPTEASPIVPQLAEHPHPPARHFL